jgi:hypothetical protein
LQDAAFDVLNTILEMRVARIDVGPGIKDRDDRPSLPIRRSVAHLHDAGAVPEGSQIVRTEPAGASERLWRFFWVRHEALPEIALGQRWPRYDAASKQSHTFADVASTIRGLSGARRFSEGLPFNYVISGPEPPLQGASPRQVSYGPKPARAVALMMPGAIDFGLICVLWIG